MTQDSDQKYDKTKVYYSPVLMRYSESNIIDILSYVEN